MNPVARAIWAVESSLGDAVSLEGLAALAGVTPYHLTRAFGHASGRPLMRYVRERRLSEAARVLAGGAPDILAVALAAGYGSHEAFTRAFREHFGITPEAARANPGARLTLTEPLIMNPDTRITLEAPRLVDASAFRLAGLDRRYAGDESAAIPSQWQAFGEWIGRVPGQRGRVAYGVIHDADDAGAAGYLCGVEVDDFTRLPEGFARLALPARRYAVFHHPGHVAEIRRVWQAIWSEGLSAAGLEPVAAPEFERYDERFDPATGGGGFEIWIPVAP